MVNALVSKAGKKASFAGSNPAIRNRIKLLCNNLIKKGFVAQLVERLPYKENVVGSSPTKPTKNITLYKLISSIKSGYDGIGRRISFRS